MKIQLVKLGEEGNTFEGEESATILELDEERFTRAVGPVEYQLFAERVAQELIVQGIVGCTLDIQCRRCADFFSTRVEDSAFLRAYEIPQDPDVVDVTPDLREAVLLGMPVFPVCREDCAGLCARCGANLNMIQCDCAAPPDEGRWGALDSLNLTE